MAYTPYYPNGWVNNEIGGTPISAEALNHMDGGISAVDARTRQRALTLATSTYFPATYVYFRDGLVHFSCVGTMAQAVAAGQTLTVGAASAWPADYRPSGQVVSYSIFTADGNRMRLAVAADGTVTYTPSGALAAGAAVNIHETLTWNLPNI